MSEYYDCNGRLIAVIVRNKTYKKPDGIQFFTNPEQSLQVAFMSHTKGREITAHVHVPTMRTIQTTGEVLFVKRGRVRVTLYGDGTECQYEELGEGDVAILIAGGHGFKMLEDTELWEVKQGPYLGEKDKVLLQPSVSDQESKSV